MFMGMGAHGYLLVRLIFAVEWLPASSSILYSKRLTLLRMYTNVHGYVSKTYEINLCDGRWLRKVA